MSQAKVSSRVLFGLVALASTVTSALVLAVGPDNPPGIWTRDVLYVETAEELFTSSSLVVEGTIVESSKGRVVGEGEGALGFREIVVDVFKSWSDQTKEGERNKVTVELVGWDGDGTEYAHINGQAVPQIGESWVMFLVEKSDAPGVYRLVTSTAFVKTVDGKIQDVALEGDESHNPNPLERFQSLPVDELHLFLDDPTKQEGN